MTLTPEELEADDLRTEAKLNNDDRALLALVDDPGTAEDIHERAELRNLQIARNCVSSLKRQELVESSGEKAHGADKYQLTDKGKEHLQAKFGEERRSK